VVFGLKIQSMSVQNLFSARLKLPLLFSMIGSGKRHQDVLPASLFAVFRTSGLLSLPVGEIRADKLPVDPGHLQGELVGGHPHHCYRRAHRRHRCPVVDRVLQKNTHIADDHAKNSLKQFVSIKYICFQVMFPCAFVS
jgi:hypothetical protein